MPFNLASTNVRAVCVLGERKIGAWPTVGFDASCNCSSFCGLDTPVQVGVQIDCEMSSVHEGRHLVAMRVKHIYVMTATHGKKINSVAKKENSIA
jgi:hypothetical protein